MFCTAPRLLVRSSVSRIFAQFVIWASHAHCCRRLEPLGFSMDDLPPSGPPAHPFQPCHHPVRRISMFFPYEPQMPEKDSTCRPQQSVTCQSPWASCGLDCPRGLSGFRPQRLLCSFCGRFLRHPGQCDLLLLGCSSRPHLAASSGLGSSGSHLRSGQSAHHGYPLA